MPNAERFKYSPVPTGVAGQNVFVPLLPLRLERAGRVVNVSGLVDSGAAVSVMPYSVGLALGAEWERQKIPLVLGWQSCSLRCPCFTRFSNRWDVRPG